MRISTGRAAAALLWVGVCTLPSAGQLDIAATVTPLGGGGFHYAYELTNLTPTDIAIVTIAVPPGVGSVQNLVFPDGFLAHFDPGLGLVDFLEGSQAFAPNLAVSGFAFDSPLGPGAAAYTALDINGGQLAGTTTAPVPEPATGLLLGAASAALLRVRRRHA